jgi:hypothetical protein
MRTLSPRRLDRLGAPSIPVIQLGPLLLQKRSLFLSFVEGTS